MTPGGPLRSLFASVFAGHHSAEAISVEGVQWRGRVFDIVLAYLNSILIIGCYTSSNRGKRRGAEHRIHEGRGRLTRAWREYIMAKEVSKETTEALGDSSVVKLTPIIKDIKRSSL
jgi:hypothetical protein